MADKLSEIQKFEAARAIMKSDFGNIILRESRDPLGGKELYVLSGGVDNLIEFTRMGRPNPGGIEQKSEIQRIAYVFEDQKLIRRVLAHENPAPQTEARDQILIDALGNADVTFFKAPNLTLLSGNNQTVVPTPVINSSNIRFEDQIAIAPGELMEVSVINMQLEFQDGRELTQYFELNL